MVPRNHDAATGTSEACQWLLVSQCEREKPSNIGSAPRLPHPPYRVNSPEAATLSPVPRDEQFLMKIT